MDWKAIEKLAKYDKNDIKAGLLLEITDNFFRELPGHLEGIKQNIVKEDCNSIMHTAHKLKGSSYIIGAESLGNRFHDLETMAQNEDLTGIEKFMIDLEETSQNTEKEIRRFLKQFNE